MARLLPVTAGPLGGSRAALALGLLACLSACGSPAPGPEPAVPAADDFPPVSELDPTWAERVTEVPRAATAHPDSEVRDAVMDDASQAGDEQVPARRLVYRLSFVVPPSFAERRARLLAPAGELHLDVSSDRLRARFVGPGWPVDAGTEVRLRRDLPGVYVFDGLGGRSLGPGQMAAWFEGREGGHSRSNVRVRREFGVSEHGDAAPGELLCTLLAEWTNQDRAALERRCAGGSLPPGFRFGPWSAEMTAVVPLTLPRHALRADQVDPPPIIEHFDSRPMLEPSDMARLGPRRALNPQASSPGQSGLEVENRTDTRVIVMAQGVPIGWVDAGATGHFEGLPPGMYRIGALRPFGVLRMAPKSVQVPAHVSIGR